MGKILGIDLSKKELKEFKNKIDVVKVKIRYLRYNRIKKIYIIIRVVSV